MGVMGDVRFVIGPTTLCMMADAEFVGMWTEGKSTSYLCIVTP
jgi:hypothetical protein